MTLCHATCVAAFGKGVLIEGPPGSGKSDLALRLLGRGAKLVSDDYVELSCHDASLVAAAPEKIAGRMEVRGIGLVEVEHLEKATIALVIELKPRDEIPRLPDPRKKTLEGCRVPLYALNAYDASTVDKVLMILKNTQGS